MNIKNAQEISSKQIETQKEQTKLTNDNQIASINLSAQKQFDVLTETLNNNLKLQEEEYKKQKAAQLDKEQREDHNKVMQSTNILIADIAIRIGFLQDKLLAYKKYQEQINDIKLSD